MKKFWTIWILIILFSAEIFAAPIVKSKHGALYIENATYAELGKIFAEHNFVEFGQSNLKIPRIYVKNLPTDWQKIKQSDEKNQMFIGIMLPLIMKINEELDENLINYALNLIVDLHHLLYCSLVYLLLVYSYIEYLVDYNHY